MVRILTGLFIAALLGGCVVLPLDYEYRGGRHEHRHQSDRWGDRHHDGGDRHWRHRDRGWDRRR